MTSTKFEDKRCSDCSPCCINVVIILPLDYGHAQCWLVLKYIMTKNSCALKWDGKSLNSLPSRYSTWYRAVCIVTRSMVWSTNNYEHYTFSYIPLIQCLFFLNKRQHLLHLPWSSRPVMSHHTLSLLLPIGCHLQHTYRSNCPLHQERRNIHTKSLTTLRQHYVRLN